MIVSICPFCNEKSTFITWTLTNVKCTRCKNVFHYLKVEHKIEA